MPVSQMDGPQVHLADLPLAVPFDTVKQYEDYIARLHQIPRVFTQTEEILRAGKTDGLMPVRFLLEKVPGQCLGVIAADPFLLPTKKFPTGISPEDIDRLGGITEEELADGVRSAHLEDTDGRPSASAPANRSAACPSPLDRLIAALRPATSRATGVTLAGLKVATPAG